MIQQAQGAFSLWFQLELATNRAPFSLLIFSLGQIMLLVSSHYSFICNKASTKVFPDAILEVSFLRSAPHHTEPAEVQYGVGDVTISD